MVSYMILNKSGNPTRLSWDESAKEDMMKLLNIDEDALMSISKLIQE